MINCIAQAVFNLTFNVPVSSVLIYEVHLIHNEFSGLLSLVLFFPIVCSVSRVRW
jgi:hypothetical protein